MKDTITKLMIAITLIAMLLGIAGCYTERTAQRQIDKAHHKYPLVPAKLCAERYPPRDSISIVKEYIQGEHIVFTDTLIERNVMLDTLILTKYITRTIKTTDTLRDTRYVQQENKARLILKDGEIKKLLAEVHDMTNSRNSWRKWCLIFGAMLFALLFFKVVRTYFLKK